jgi:hypothetical protein
MTGVALLALLIWCTSFTDDALLLDWLLYWFYCGKLLDLHALGADCEDPQFCDEIENYLGDQVGLLFVSL